MMSPQTRSNLTAADVMTPNPRTCSNFSTVLEAVLIFQDADCGGVPVLEDGMPVGVLTDRDVALALADHDNLTRLPVSQIMMRGVVAVPPDASLDIVVEQFGGQGVRRLLVVDAQGQLVGIIGWVDIAPYVPDGKIGQAVSEVLERP